MTPRLFIVEGPDGSGKSTLSRFLCRTLRAGYMHMSGHRSLHQGMEAYHLETLESAKVMLDVSGLPVIIDRHWPSEYCYGRTLRPSISLMSYDYEKIFKSIINAPVTYIFCQRKTTPVAKQFDELDEAHPFDRDDYVRIHGEYHSLVEGMRGDKQFHVVEYDRDVQGHDLESFVKGVLDAINK